MAYIPPDGNDANFEILVYVAPDGNEANFNLTGTEASTRDSEVLGKEDAANERNSELTGAGIPSERDSEVAGKITTTNDRDSELIGKAFLSIPRTYRIIIRDENDVILGEIDTFRNLKFGKRLNNYGTASFQIPVTDPKAASLIALRKYTVWIYYQKDANTTLVWSGEQAAREGELDDRGNNWCTIYCYDWLEQLNARYTASERLFRDVDAGQIAWSLIEDAQSLRVDGLQGDVFGNNVTIGTEEWQDEGNAATANSVYSSVDLGTGSQSHYLFAQDFDFAIPSGAIITGIKADIKLWQDKGAESHNAIDASVKIMKNDFISGDDQARGNDVPLDNSFVTYGGLGNLWGTTWTPADINDIEFGVGFSYSGIGSVVNVDYIKLTVYYYLADTNADFGITEGTIEATVNRDRTYYNQNVMEAIINLANVLSGFDFEITNNRVFNVYEVMGNDKTEDVVLEYGRNIASAKVFEDFTSPVNRGIVIGQSTDNLFTLIRVETDDTALQAEYKLREGLLSEMDVSETDTMEEKGGALIRKYGTPLFKIDINLASVLEPNITQFGLGDSITLIVQSGIYDINEQYRVFEYEVTFDDNNVEKLTLVLGNFTYE